MKSTLHMRQEVPIVIGLVLTVLTTSCVQSMKVDIDELLSNAQSYQGKEICTEGVYASGSEISALGASTHEVAGAIYLTGPTIWIEGADIRSRTDCFKTDTIPPTEFCQVTVCGLLETGGNYGHLGAYKYQLQGRND